MKKALAILLALVMAFALVACNGDGATPSTTPPASTNSGTPSTTSPAATDSAAPVDSDAPPASGKAYPNANEDGTINLDTVAHFDKDYDYTQNEKFKIAYLAQDGGPLYQQSADAYEHWTPIFNCEWAGFVSANGDTDLFMTNLQNMIDQGVNGFIVDPDTTIMQAVVTLLNQHPEVAWLTQMAAPRDGATGEGLPIGGNMMNNYVGFDNVDAGAQQAIKLVEWKEENLPDVPWNEIGFLAMAFSVSPPLYERVIGAKEVWVEATGSDANFFEADTAAVGLNLQGGLDAAGPVITTNSQIKHWLVMGLIDDLAQAAASILDQQGLTEGSCVVTFGGSALQMQWDGGQQDAFRYALFTAQSLYAEPIMGAIYAFLNGWATPETIWPSWVKWDDHGGEGHTYSQLRLPTEWLEFDTYKTYLEWTDMYSQANIYDYPQDGINIDAFSPFAEVPAEFAQP